MFNSKLKQQILQLQQDNIKLKCDLDAQKLSNSILENKCSDYYKLKASLDSISSVSDKLQSINDDIKSKKSELKLLQSQIDNIESANYIHTLGFFDLKNDSKYYQDELNANRSQQKLMLSNKTYFKVKEKWIINNSAKEGSKLLEFFVKICMSSYNLFCDNTIDKTNIVNQQYLKDRVKRIYDGYNKELSAHGVELSADYLKLKLAEIDIRLNIYIAKENEKEEENRRKEVLREQVKCEVEIKKNKDRLIKELLHYQIQLNKGADVQDKINEIEARIETEDYLLNKNSAGYVYFIKSKSFNDDEYTKVGVTKRIDPLMRIAELSNASVPFKFYPLAIVFSEQAFDLEHRLHQRLDKYRVNKFNTRKEHFKISDDELLKIVRDEFGYDIEFNEIIDEDWIYTNNFKGEDK